ncbi:MAG: 1-acyl-sn-glycerol-3-phosphate acyltransferase, partial [Deltaproteobacteria bacterium]|nr:1-acyl-sn-glycerol-3-phosphate acyltransferase [Deltaproteobacteria bacterium]
GAGVLVIVAGLFDYKGRMYDLISRVWSNAILYTAGIKVTIEGLDNVDRNTPHIFMSNHLSHLDTAAFIAKIPFRIRFFAKKELLRVPVFGQALYMSRHIIIDRKNTEKAKKSISDAKERIRRYGLSVLVFPEGTRSTTGKLGEFKKGGFVLAIEAGIPIVPIAVKGSLELLPAHTLLVRSGRIRINIGRPIAAADYTRDTKQALMGKVRAEIERLGLQSG